MTVDRQSDPRPVEIKTYTAPAGGWGSLEGIASVVKTEGDLPALELMRQNKADGFMCVSCAWAKPAKPHPAEFCENGAKATIWDLTPRRCTPAFFAEHTVSELRGLERLRPGTRRSPYRADAV